MTKHIDKHEALAKEFRARLREELKDRQALVRQARENLTRHDRMARTRRRSWSREIVAARLAARVASGKTLVDKRADRDRLVRAFRIWWARIQRARAAKRAAIRAAQAELHAARKMRPQVIRQAMATAELEARQRDKLIDHAEEAHRERLLAILKEAQRQVAEQQTEIQRERRYYRKPKQTRRGAARKRTERASELEDAIRSNLDAGELIQWKRDRQQIMALAKRRGYATNPDRIAELFREHLESHPDNLEAAQLVADTQLAAWLREAGEEF